MRAFLTSFQRFIPELTGKNTYGLVDKQCRVVAYHLNERIKDAAGACVPMDVQKLSFDEKNVRKAHTFVCDYVNVFKKGDVNLIRTFFQPSSADRLEIVKRNQPSITYCVNVLGKRELVERPPGYSVNNQFFNDNQTMMISDEVKKWKKHTLLPSNALSGEYRKDPFFSAFVRSNSICRLKYADVLREASREFKIYLP